jgi:hypothetical protein
LENEGLSPIGFGAIESLANLFHDDAVDQSRDLNDIHRREVTGS